MLKRAVAVVPTAAAFAALLLSQSQEPAFEVVSVKASAPGASGKKGGGGRANDPGMFTWHNRPLQGLILYAYDLQDYQLAGGPGWLSDTRFDIDARTPGPATYQQKLAMVRTLLADRFQLRTHRESKQLEAYVMTVAKGGPKFGPQFQKSDDDKVFADNRQFDKDLGMNLSGSMSSFANLIRRNMGVIHAPDSPFTGPAPPVIDQTGLDGVYLIFLKLHGPMDDLPTQAESQLGLQLTLRKLPVEMLVIDSLAKPTEN